MIMKTDKTDNELIAEFYDGTVFNSDGLCTDPERKYSWRPGCYDPLRIQHLRYDKSWDWLMPVVEKISKAKPMNQAWYDVSSPLVRADIHVVHNRVVEFIKWHNSQPKP